jgi:tellurite resistance protein
MNAERIPLNLFGVPFGLAGLANAWYYAGRHDQTPGAVADVLTAIAAAVARGELLPRPVAAAPAE